jgi:hypothetical protein
MLLTDIVVNNDTVRVINAQMHLYGIRGAEWLMLVTIKTKQK